MCHSCNNPSPVPVQSCGCNPEPAQTTRDFDSYNNNSPVGNGRFCRCPLSCAAMGLGNTVFRIVRGLDNSLCN